MLQNFDLKKLTNEKGFWIPNSEVIVFYNPKEKKYVFFKSDPKHKYTAEESILLFPENAPFQLIHGKINFIPAPFFSHQKISAKLHLAIGGYVYNRKIGEVIAAPIDVHFDEYNVLQPDLLFVSVKRSSIIQKWILGAPDFVVEIMSSKSNYEKTKKKKVYEKYEVLEYWIVYPQKQCIEVYQNENKNMKLVQTAKDDDIIISSAIEGFTFRAGNAFE